MDELGAVAGIIVVEVVGEGLDIHALVGSVRLLLGFGVRHREVFLELLEVWVTVFSEMLNQVVFQLGLGPQAHAG